MTFIEDLEKCSWGDVYSERDVNSARSKWKELFLSVLNKRAPICHKVLRGIICPWLTSATKKLMNERDSFLRKARKTGSEVDWSTYRRLRKFPTGSKLRSVVIRETKFRIIWPTRNHFEEL